MVAALESAFQRHACPKHFVTDKGPAFTAPGLAAFLVRHDVKHRTGAVGCHGSVSITERLFESFKYEWLRRVPLIRGFDHLTELCVSFSTWYGQWRPHQGIAGARPDDVYHSATVSPPLAGVDRSRAKKCHRRSRQSTSPTPAPQRGASLAPRNSFPYRPLSPPADCGTGLLRCACNHLRISLSAPRSPQMLTVTRRAPRFRR